MARKAKPAEEPEDGAAPEEPRKKRGVLLPALVVAIAVVAAGAMAGGFIGGGGDAMAEETEAAPTETTPELGTVTELESITLNLAGGVHFLKLGVAVETAPEVAEVPPTAPILDVVIDLFGSMTYEELTQAEVREATKAELLERLSAVYGTDIVRVYYTEFVMQ